MRGDCGVLCGVFWAAENMPAFEIYFGIFPFWESGPGGRHTPGAKTHYWQIQFETQGNQLGLPALG
jgi:hypothetical protein